MDYSLLHYVSFLYPLYFIVFFGMIIEGDVVLFISSFLAHQGILSLPLFIAVAVGGVVLGDLLWYWFGKYGQTDFFLYSWFSRLSSKLNPHLEKRLFSTILITKFAYGLGHLTSMRLGANGLSTRDFLKKNGLASAIWFILILSLGYASGAAFPLLRKYLKFMEILILIGIVILVLLEEIVKFIFKRSD